MYGEVTITGIVDGSDTAQVVTDGGQPLLDRILVALADEQRRYVLYYLADTEVATLEECTTAVAVRETRRPPEDISPETRQRVRNQLYHQHLPKLTDLEIVEYDHQRGAVRYQAPPHINDFLQLARGIEME